MYKIIGADGKEYGPITSDQLRQWIAEGRANAQTRVLAEGTTEWKTLSEYPEFSTNLGAATPPLGSSSTAPLQPGLPPTGRGDAEQQVAGPAIGLIVMAVLNFLSGGAGFLMSLLGASFRSHMANLPNAAWVNMFYGTLGTVSNLLAIVCGVVILLGGLKMKKLESHGLAVAASILAALPCTSGCCIIGLPLGIWALVVLFRPEVKSAFH